MTSAIAMKVAQIAETHNLRRRNGRYVGPCPFCDGSARSDKFQIRDDGGYKCYACEAKGDIITWLRTVDGLSCQQAHHQAEKECRATSCQVWSSCRMGGGDGSRRYTPRSISPVRQQVRKLPAAAEGYPTVEWMAWADGLVASAAKHLQDNHQQLAWLAKRGLDGATVSRAELGWLARSTSVKREQLGMAPRQHDNKLTAWVPDGLLIPFRDEHGRIYKMRVRRPDASRKDFLPDIKYYEIEGSGKLPLVIRPQGRPRGAAIIEAELDSWAAAGAHQDILVIGLTTVGAGLPPSLRQELTDIPAILVALDAERNDDGSPGAGPKAIAAWQREFRQARFWPVPDGKDPGHYAELGGNLHDWLESGLPPKPRQAVPSSAVHEPITSAGSSQRGERGAENTPAENEAEPTPLVREMTVPDGRTIYVVDAREDWEALLADGKIAFSANEMARLQQAVTNMSEYERQQYLSLTLDIKETFCQNKAWIRRGAVIGEQHDGDGR